MKTAPVRRKGIWLVSLHVLLLLAAPFLAERTNSLVGFVAVMIGGCALLPVISRHAHLSWRTVIVVAVILRAGAFWLPPGLSDDAFRYAWDGQLQTEGFNPYLVLPDDEDVALLRDRQIFERLNSADFYSVYPPLSQATFGVAAFLTKGDWPAVYYAIKFILILGELVVLWVLAKLVLPSRAVLYAWNPVVVLEIAGQGHTEGLAVGLLAMSILASRRGKAGVAGAAIAGAGMVKLYPLVLLPLFARRLQWKAIAGATAVTLVLTLPYASVQALRNVAESLDLYVRYFEFNAGPYLAVKEIVRFATGEDWSKTIGPLFRWLFVAALPLIYIADWRLRWSLEKSMIVVLAAFFFFSTTIHPWYLVPMLCLLVFEDKYRWHWYWLAGISVGTYLIYVDGPYWGFVITGWGIWTVLVISYHFDDALQTLQRVRGRRKWREIAGWVNSEGGARLLDLGSGEGYVGLAAATDERLHVQLADVVDMNRTDLPWTRVDVDRLPFATDAYEYVVLYFVLHHSRQPERVLAEASRVASHRIIVVESLYHNRLQLWLLTILDKLANRLRSKGLMAHQEDNLDFRRFQEWQSAFKNTGLRVVESRRRGRWIHPRGYFLLEIDTPHIYQ